MYRSPIVVGLLNGGWTEYGLSNAVVDDVPDVVLWSHPAWLLVMGRGPSVGWGGGGSELSGPRVGVAVSDFVRLLAGSLFVRSCIGEPMST